MRFASTLLIMTALLAQTAFALTFTDDFEDDDLVGWDCVEPDCSQDWFAQCSGGTGTAVALLPWENVSSTLCVAGHEWSDLQIDLDLRPITGENRFVFFRRDSQGQAYRLNVKGYDFILARITGSSIDTLAITTATNRPGRWSHIIIRAIADRIQIWYDELFGNGPVLKIDVTDPNPLLAGGVCMGGQSSEGTAWYNGCAFQFDNVLVFGEGTVGVAAPTDLGSTRAPIQNNPNPLGPTTTVVFETSERGDAELMIYGVDGRLVRRIFATELDVGRHELIWDGTDDGHRGLSPGTYLYLLRLNGKAAGSGKAVLLN